MADPKQEVTMEQAFEHVRKVAQSKLGDGAYHAKLATCLRMILLELQACDQLRKELADAESEVKQLLCVYRDSTPAVASA